MDVNFNQQSTGRCEENDITVELPQENLPRSSCTGVAFFWVAVGWGALPSIWDFGFVLGFLGLALRRAASAEPSSPSLKKNRT